MEGREDGVMMLKSEGAQGNRTAVGEVKENKSIDLSTVIRESNNEVEWGEGIS